MVSMNKAFLFSSSGLIVAMFHILTLSNVDLDVCHITMCYIL
jgi:hypothetical protein